MKIESRLVERFDIPLFLTVLALVAVGFVAIYSATYNSIVERANFEKQIFSFALALVVFFAVYATPTKYFKQSAIALYGVSILLLIVVLAVGKVVGGQRSWINLGFFNFQPAEFAKIATIFAVARYLSESTTDIDKLKDIGIALAIGMFPVVLILLEPDLGSSIVFFAVILAMLYWKGISLFGMFVVLSPGFVAISALFGEYFLLAAFAIVVGLLFVFRQDLFLSASILALNVAAAFFVDYVYGLLSPHQQLRILSFVDPTLDPQGVGYNANQAQIAVGSGGLLGKGYLEGHQTQLQFIPEQWTDFIFCVVGEEFGFVGSIVVIGLFVYLLYRMTSYTKYTRDEFLSLSMIGAATVFFAHFAVNVGMAIGVMPVIGIPLPFVSYGGSSLLMNMAMLGMFFSVYRARKE
ncbi:MAG: rod shape-determining protein RodA [Ignavibacteriales bacterium]|nr:rod shape-determining protein RodA [Ignavibacteriales bacterium]